jgi:hypothetical protein
MSIDGDSGKSNREAAMWLAFVILTLTTGSLVTAVLVLTLQIPLLFAIVAAAPVAAFFGSMCALVEPLRRAITDIVVHIFPWLSLSS